MKMCTALGRRLHTWTITPFLCCPGDYTYADRFASNKIEGYRSEVTDYPFPFEIPIKGTIRCMAGRPRFVFI